MAATSWTQTRMWDLFDLGPLFGSGLDCYLDVMLERIVQWFQASGGSIFLGEPGDAVFGVVAKQGLQSTLPPDTTVRVGAGIAGVVAASGTARIVDDPRKDLDLDNSWSNPSSPIISAMVVPIVDHEGRVFGVMNIARTIGEQLFREPDLEQAEIMAAHMSLAISNAQMVEEMALTMDKTRTMNEKLVAVLDSVSSAVLVVDPDGQVVNQNKISADMLFWAAQPPEELIPLRTKIGDTIRQLSGRTQAFVERCHDDISDRTWMIEATPLGSGGGVITVREVTHIESREREMARVKRLAEIGQMTAAIAHEIRNPLTGIRSAAQTVRDYPDLADDLLGMIDDEVTKLNQLCEDFLDFAKPLHVEAKPGKLTEVVKRVTMLVQPDFDKKKVSLNLQPKGESVAISLDTRRIEQVLVNLLRNALQASAKGSEVTVEWDSSWLAVVDHGIGIPEDLKTKLFSPFFTTKSDGTGLGLCTVRKIMDAHGGSITVESEVGQGSRFLLEFSGKNE